MKTTKNKKRMNMGGQVPAASFLEQPTVDPFAASSQPVKNSAEFTARSGGVKKKLFGGTAEMRALKKSQREERKEARQDRREDRRLTRQTVRSVKSDMRKDRNAEPFVDGSGPIVELTRDQKRDDRKATRTASRLFKKQERTERRQSKQDLRTKQSGEKATQKETDKGNKANAIAKKLREFNEKKIYNEIDVLEKNNPTGNNNNSNTTTTAKVKPEVKKEVTPEVKPAKKQSFGQAFRENRKAGKKEFEWNGKKYHTKTKSEETTSSSSSSSSSNPKDETKVGLGPNFYNNPANQNIQQSDRTGPNSIYNKKTIEIKLDKPILNGNEGKPGFDANGVPWWKVFEDKYKR